MRVTTLGGDPSVPLREAGNAAAAADKKRLPPGVTLAELADEYRVIIGRDHKRPDLATGHLGGLGKCFATQYFPYRQVKPLPSLSFAISIIGTSPIMPSASLHQKLRKLVGKDFSYLSCDWRLIDVLADDDRLVLQRLRPGQHGLQSNQYGQASRRCPETLTLPISDPDDPETFSEELLLLMRGKRA